MSNNSFRGNRRRDFYSVSQVNMEEKTFVGLLYFSRVLGWGETCTLAGLPRYNGNYLIGFLLVGQRFFSLGTPFCGYRLSYGKGLTAWISYRAYRVCPAGFYYSGGLLYQFTIYVAFLPQNLLCQRFLTAWIGVLWSNGKFTLFYIVASSEIIMFDSFTKWQECITPLIPNGI